MKKILRPVLAGCPAGIWRSQAFSYWRPEWQERGLESRLQAEFGALAKPSNPTLRLEEASEACVRRLKGKNMEARRCSRNHVFGSILLAPRDLIRGGLLRRLRWHSNGDVSQANGVYRACRRSLGGARDSYKVQSKLDALQTLRDTRMPFLPYESVFMPDRTKLTRPRA